MFTPSLVSMVLHSVWSDSDVLRGDANYHDAGELANALDEGLGWSPLATPAQVPIMGRTLDPSPALRFLDDRIHVSRVDGSPVFFFWGRPLVSQLVPYIRELSGYPADREYVDLAPPVGRLSTGGGLVTDCRNLIQNAATGNIAVNVAMVDSCKTVQGGPEDFGGKLHHAHATGLEMSDHALRVLKVLLERLDHHQKLPETRLLASLFTPPIKQVGLKSFEHAGAVEMLDALDHLVIELKKPLYGDPIVVTMSLGAHVGPHNGDSPLEEYITTNFAPSSSRYFHAAAGNDGLSGVAARLELLADVRDFLRVQTGPAPGSELLVELWWDDSAGAQVTIEADVRDQRHNQVFSAPVKINSSTPKTVLTRVGTPQKGVLCETLMHAKCKGNMNCAALALSAPGGALPAALNIDLTLESAADITIGAWIVVGGGASGAFIEGSPSGTIRVPACAPEVFCVSGITGAKKPWSRSSRGPVGDLGGGTPASAPRLAHLVNGGGDDGTSYACPRAAADSANVLSTPGTSPCGALDELARRVLAVATLPSWNPRTGYGEIDK